MDIEWPDGGAMSSSILRLVDRALYPAGIAGPGGKELKFMGPGSMPEPLKNALGLKSARPPSRGDRRSAGDGISSNVRESPDGNAGEGIVNVGVLNDWRRGDLLGW